MNLPAVAEMLDTIAAQPRLAVRKSIQALVDHMKAMPEAEAPSSCPVKHLFAPGVYIREMTVPAGMLVVGKIHRHQHANIISKGKLQVVTEWGSSIIEAPCSFVSEPGTRRVAHAIEECVWATIHATNETDLDKLEAQLIAEDYTDIELDAEFEECTP